MEDDCFEKVDLNVEEAMLMKECCVEDEMKDSCLVKSDLNIGEESLIMECLFEDHGMDMCFAKSNFEYALAEKTMADTLWDSCSEFVDKKEVNALSTILDFLLKKDNTKDYLIDGFHVVTIMGTEFLKIANCFVEHKNCLEEAMYGAFETENCFVKIIIIL